MDTLDPLLQLAGAVKDPMVLVVSLWLILEVRSLRAKVGRLLDDQAGARERLAVLEERTGGSLPTAPAAAGR